MVEQSEAQIIKTRTGTTELLLQLKLSASGGHIGTRNMYAPGVNSGGGGVPRDDQSNLKEFLIGKL